jgi:hypothetical protein
MLRTVRRWFLDAEVRDLAKDVDLMRDRVMDYGHKVDGLQGRIERLVQRTSMRLARAGVEVDPRDEEIWREIRARRGNGDDLPDDPWRAG